MDKEKNTVIPKQFVCPVCGKKFTAEIAPDLDEPERVGLDTNTHNPLQFEKVVICPECGYSSAQYANNEDQEIIDFVNSEEYKSLLKSEWSEGFKKWMLAGFVSKFAGYHFDAGYEFMTAGWYIREFGGDTDDLVYAFNMAVSEFATYVDESNELKPALILLDLLRQTGDFEKATDFAFGLKDSEVDDQTKKIIDFELECISKKDITEHYMDEV